MWHVEWWTLLELNLNHYSTSMHIDHTPQSLGHLYVVFSSCMVTLVRYLMSLPTTTFAFAVKHWFWWVITDPTKITLHRSFTYLTQMLKHLGNLCMPVMPATKWFSWLSCPLHLPICLPQLQLSPCRTFPPGSWPWLSHSLTHLQCSWPLTKVVQIMSSWA